ncbi:MAG: DUF2892 domain-containing protein [Rhodobacteraceae bacterium]|nr:DUF2892 domain-containing protein [Paracoccaceae bacterium]
MIANVGNRDRLVRGGLGLLMLVAAYFTPASDFASPAMYYVVVAVGVILIATAVMKSCLIYRVLGISTAKG